MKLGKAIVIILAAISLVVVPVSLFYVKDVGVYTLEFQGRFFDAKIGGESGFGFFKFVSTGTNMFSPQAWNSAFTDQTVLGLQAGTLMMILWYVSMGLMIIGIIVAFFKIKLSGLFFVLAFITDGLQALIWYLGMKQAISPELMFPIPVSVLFLLVTFVLAFTSKKKESYYYSPGYSYGYGRR